MNLKVKIRNGYKFGVIYDREKSVFVGFGMFFSQFGLIGGETLVFEYIDDHRFKMYIVGSDGCEIYYPDVVHPCQKRNAERGITYLLFNNFF